MRMKKKISPTLFFLLTIFVFASPYATETNKETLYVEENSFNLKQTLEGITSFEFQAKLPNLSKETLEKANRAIQQQLGIQGKLQLPDTPTQTDPKSIPPILQYELTDLASERGELLEIVKASLLVLVPVEIMQTKKMALACIWEKNCYVRHPKETSLDAFIPKTLHYLLDEFSARYSLVNSEKPTFNMQK